MDGNNKAAYGLDKILCLHSLAHSATKIIYNFFWDIRVMLRYYVIAVPYLQGVSEIVVCIFNSLLPLVVNKDVQKK